MNRTLKERVLDLDQESIYASYFEISKDDVSWSASRYSNKLSNPYREDCNPSLSFAWFGNKLICRDFADPAYSGDIFKVVGYILNMNYTLQYLSIVFDFIFNKIIQHNSIDMICFN